MTSNNDQGQRSSDELARIRWAQWREERYAAAAADHGVASATGTYWLTAEPVEVPGLPGRWWAEHGRVHSDGLSRPEPALAAGEDLSIGTKVTRIIARGGDLAVRVLDPDAPTRTELTAIDAFAFDPEWRRSAHFVPAAEPTIVHQADGGEVSGELAGDLRWTQGEDEFALRVFPNGDGIRAVFADRTNGEQTKQFRFLDIALAAPADQEQTVLVDFNRAYLPPCSFADAYLCPLPPAGNRLEIAVTAGETRQRYTHADAAPAETALVSSSIGGDAR